MNPSHKMAVLAFILLFPLFLMATWPESIQASDTDSTSDMVQDSEDTTKNESGDSFEDVLEGFDEEQPADISDDQNTSDQEGTFEGKPGLIDVSVNGHAKLRSTYNYAHQKPEPGETDWRGISSLLSELMLTIDTKIGPTWQARISGKAAYDGIYDLNGRDEYTDDVIDHYINELELLETYIQGSISDNLDIKAGRQVVVWGTLDNIRVTDTLNPLDIREPGATDIEDLRLPVTMLRVDGYLSNWTLTGIAIPEIRFNKNPEFGSDFYPSDTPPVDEEIPESGFETMEYAVSLSGVFSGWDISFYWADVYADMPHVELTGDFFETELKHARLNLVGGATNIALGNWLIKAEAVHLTGFNHFNSPDESFSRTDLGAGLEYSGFSEMTLSAEMVQRHILEYEDVLEDAPDNLQEKETQTVLRLTKNWLNDTLSLTILATAFGSEFDRGSFQRYLLEYDLSDNMTLKGGLMAYQNGDTTGFDDIGENDRLFLEFKYNF